MSIFGNESGMVGARIAPDTWTEGDSGFAAMGKPIPFHRQQTGYEHCKEMGLDTEAAFSAVRTMSEQLERDKPLQAMEAAKRYLDVTGCYRLMAVLLTAEKAPPSGSAPTEPGEN
jgi:hypothetical protein